MLNTGKPNPRCYINGHPGENDGWYVILHQGSAMDRRRTLVEAAAQVRHIERLKPTDPVYQFLDGAFVVVE